MRSILTYIVLLGGCHSAERTQVVDLGPAPVSQVANKEVASINPRLLRRFKPLQVVPRDTAPSAVARVALGTQLFFDPRLSSAGDTSCHTCHSFERGGADPRPTSPGPQGGGTRNAPTVYNAAWHVAQFWDGREPDVEHQAGAPILNSKEMGMRDAAEVTQVLRSIPGYRAEFLAAFGPDSVDFAHATQAIAAFERTLHTPSRWDTYLRGDHHALTPPELEGLKVFSDVGCIDCHTGELVGGSMFQRAGVVEPWPNQADQGRFAITHVETDRMVFKVPSLRNVTLTAPYFHDGSVPRLPDAIRMMGKYELGIELSDKEVTAVVAWLGALAGQEPQIRTPTLPPDGPATASLLGPDRSASADPGGVLDP
ncbi:MAG: hypothetical protein IPQ07_08045 [Myxococcales bacterium]|nr:hypothetical protein [Myxococcales bacterium]